MPSETTPKTRIPLRAIVFVAVVSLFALAEIALLGLFLMPMIPLIPVFVMLVIGHACLIAPVVEYATSLARVEPVSTSRAEAFAQKPEASASKAHQPA